MLLFFSTDPRCPGGQVRIHYALDGTDPAKCGYVIGRHFLTTHRPASPFSFITDDDAYALAMWKLISRLILAEIYASTQSTKSKSLIQ